MGAEDWRLGVGGGRARKKLGYVLHRDTADRIRGGRRLTNTKEISIEKRRVIIAAKTGKNAAGTTGKGLLLRARPIGLVRTMIREK